MKCNHCGIAYHPTWSYTHRVPESSQYVGDRYALKSSMCPACKEYNISWICGELGLVTSRQDITPRAQPHKITKEVLVNPTNSFANRLPDAVAENIRNDFDEAALVLDLSPRASAALGRRLLEIILIERGAPASKNLHAQIEWAIKDLPSYIADEIHLIREIGKFAAHSKEDTSTGVLLDVTIEEAQAVLSLIEALCDFYYIQPAKSAARRASVKEKLERAKGRSS